MRILFLSNFFPPARPGGYTQWCYEVVEGLKERGHAPGVLTSRHERTKAPAHEQNIFRLLHLEGDLAYYQPRHFFTKWRTQHRENLIYLEKTVRDFCPEMIFVWGMWALSSALPAFAEKLLPGRVVYYLSDYWPMAKDMHTAYWQAPPYHWPMRLPKQALGLVARQMLAREKHAAPRFENAICVSHAVKRKLIAAGLPLDRARVIHGGTDVKRFSQQGHQRSRALNGTIELLYAGQIVEHKGVHTAIEAMAKVANGPGKGMAHLTIIGSGHPAYESRLRDMVAEGGLQECVQFEGHVSPTKIPATLCEYDVLIFPSIYDEPLARITQEAMASNMVVIGTTTGGTSEILSDGITGLTFPAGDADALSRQIQQLLREPGLAGRLAVAGRQRVLSYFNLERMVNEIEAYLQEVVEGLPPDHEALPNQSYA